MQVRNSTIIYLLAAALLLPALLINLGLLAFIDDEAIRALVALEMILSGNYITPTLHGEYYYNKPPLFNWILIVFFKLFGSIDEFVARLPTVAATLGYGATIFYYVRKQLSTQQAFLAAFLFITCGRMLFYDSLLALIDITFSWCMFLLFMVTYHKLEKGQYLQLFLITYLLTAIGFLFKGLPAIVFQGITLLTYFSYRRQFWKLFSWQHVLGALLFSMILGAYYLTYHQYNDLSIVAQTLFTESSKRTAVELGIGKTIKHIFTFPFELIYHFLPWSLLFIYLVHRSIRSWIQESPFILFCIITFIANIIIYWISVEVYPRYLLMLVPLAFIVFVHLHEKHKAENTWQFRSLQILFLVAISGIALLSFLPLFLAQTQQTPYLWLKTWSLIFPLCWIVWKYFKTPNLRMPLLVLFLVIFRIGFNWFVLPDRNANDFGDLCRETSRQVGKNYQNQGLKVLDVAKMQPTNSFYLTNERGKIIPQLNTDLPDFENPKGLLIVHPGGLTDTSNYQKIDKIKVRHGKMTFDLLKPKND